MEESEIEHGEASVWGTLRGRALNLRTMPPRLRLVTALAVAQVVAAAVLLAARGAHVGTTPLVGGAEGLTSVPVVILWLSVGFLALAWAYLLGGAAHAHPALRVLALAAYGTSLVPLSQDIGWHGAPAVIRGVLLAALVLVVVAGPSRRRGDVEPSALPEPVWLLILGGLTGGVLATFAWDAESHSIFRLFTFGFADALMSLSYFLLPVLYLTGAEFAEWGEVVGDRLAAVSDRLGSTRLVGALAAAISAAVLVHVISAYGSQLPLQVVLFALGAAAVVWLARRARPATGWPRTLPWAALALIAAAFIAILLIEVYRTTSLPPERGPATIAGQLRTYDHPGPPRFAIRVPEDWEVLPLIHGDPAAGPTLVGFSGRSTANRADLFVTTAPERLLARTPSLLPVFLAHFYRDLGVHIGAPVASRNGWRETGFGLGARLQGVAWERPIGRLRWLILGYSDRSIFRLDRPLFATMWGSFSVAPARPSPPASTRGAPDPYRYDPVVVVPFLIWLALTAAAATLLLLRRPARQPPSARTGLLLACAFGVLYLLSQLRAVLEQLVHGSVGPLYSVRLPGVQAAVALGTLTCLGWGLAERRRLRPGTLRTLVMLGAGLQLLLWLSQLYSSASGVGARLSIAQGLIILLALMWELVSSGESITNRHGRWLPRPSRVLLFCGYIILVASAVLFFSALRLQATGAAIEPQFESEGWPALGILQLGVPALLCLAALHLGLFGAREPDPGPAPAQATAAAPSSAYSG